MENWQPNKDYISGETKLTSVSSFESCFESLWRLIGEFDGHLQQCDRKVSVDLGGYPQSEAVVNAVCLRDGVHELVHEIQTQMTVLK